MPFNSAPSKVADDATLVRVVATNMTALLTAEAYVCQGRHGLSRFCGQPLKGCSLGSLPRVALRSAPHQKTK